MTFPPERFQELPVDIAIAGGRIVHTGAIHTPVGIAAAGTAISCSCAHR